MRQVRLHLGGSKINHERAPLRNKLRCKKDRKYLKVEIMDPDIRYILISNFRVIFKVLMLNNTKIILLSR